MVQVTAATILLAGIAQVQAAVKLLYGTYLQPSEILLKQSTGKADGCDGRSIEESRPETPSMLQQSGDNCAVSNKFG